MELNLKKSGQQEIRVPSHHIIDISRTLRLQTATTISLPVYLLKMTISVTPQVLYPIQHKVQIKQEAIQNNPSNPSQYPSQTERRFGQAWRQIELPEDS